MEDGEQRRNREIIVVAFKAGKHNNSSYKRRPVMTCWIVDLRKMGSLGLRKFPFCLLNIRGILLVGQIEAIVVILTTLVPNCV